MPTGQRAPGDALDHETEDLGTDGQGLVTEGQGLETEEGHRENDVAGQKAVGEYTVLAGFSMPMNECLVLS